MQAKEMVMLAAGPNMGKTTWLCQMALSHVTSDTEVFMLDSELKINGAMAMLTETIPDNIHIMPATNAEQIIYTIEDEIIPKMKGKKEGEVVIMIDMLNKWWEYAQEYYVEGLAKDQNMAEHMQAIVKEKKRRGDKSPTMFDDSFVDWPVIKQWHNARMVEQLMFRQPCHVLATLGTREIRSEGPIADTGKRTKIWEPLRQVNEGEKSNDYRFITVLGLQDVGLLGRPQVELFCLKDRSRKLGQVAKLFYNAEISDPDEPGYIFDIWEEFCVRTGAPKLLGIQNG